MDKWEYLSLKVVWNAEEKKWEGWLAGKVMKAEYTHELFNPLGVDGWEMVSFTAGEYWSESVVTAGVSLGTTTFVNEWDTHSYRAVFKRRLP